MDELPIAVASDARIQITADGHEPRQHQLYGELKVRHSPGGIIDVAVHVDGLGTQGRGSCPPGGCRSASDDRQSDGNNSRRSEQGVTSASTCHTHYLSEPTRW